MPRELSGAERRADIVRSCMGVFARSGFAGATTRRLADAAGISEAMVFKHFPTKEHLYRAILALKIEEAEHALPLHDLADPGPDPAAFLARIADSLFARIDRDPTFLRLLLFCALEGHPLARAFDRARGARLRRVIAAAFRRYARAGKLRLRDPDFAARAFLGLIVHFVQLRRLFQEPQSLRLSRARIVREIVDFTLRGWAPVAVKRNRP